VTDPRAGEAPARSRDGVWIFALALGARLAVVAWAAARFPPAADGAYYQRIAMRISEGLGYTWLWPDGAVTFAAHYPVGYPGAVGALYAVFGSHATIAMVLNAVLGAVAALAVHQLALPYGSRRGALVAGLLVALHPGLVAYTPALMTEGVTAALLACAVWVAARARATEGRDGVIVMGASPPRHPPRTRLMDVRSSVEPNRPCAAPEERTSMSLAILLGLIVGAATLTRPQSIVLAPVLGWLALGVRAKGLRALIGPAVVTAAAILACAPWTARNCARMGRCALVSVNGGWNLLIGADDASTGAWSPVEVPAACRKVWDEAEKDACFEREARAFIARRPGAWLALAPRKLAATFDYCGAAGWYLHESNPDAFGDRAKVILGGVETVFERLVLLAALLWASRRDWARRELAATARLAVFALGAVFTFLEHAWLGYAALVLLALLRGRALGRGPVLASGAIAVLLATMVTHGIFFGAGRYALVVFPLLTGLAAVGFAPANGVWGRVRPERDDFGADRPDFDREARDPAS